MQIEPFEPDDDSYQQLVEVYNAIWPDDKNTVGQIRYEDENRNLDYFFRRFVARESGRMVAWATIRQPEWSFQEGKYLFIVSVHPDYRRRGIGSALYEQLCETVQPLRPAKIVAETREDQVEGVRFLEKHGFQPLMRYPISELEVAAFDFKRFEPTVSAVLENGITIKTLATLQDEDEDWKQKAYDLESTLTEDVPSPDPLTPIALDHYERTVLQNPEFLPEAYYVALDGDDYVGMSNLWRNLANPERLNTGLTGVKRSYRRRGIATALKVHGVRFAQAYGAKAIETGNEENNPMFQLNLQLGYKPKPAWMDFALELEPQS